MVERLDEGALPLELGSLDYQRLYKVSKLGKSSG